MTAPGAGVPLGEVMAVLDRRYDPAWAEDWDAVGLVVGDPAAPVRHVLLAVDPVAAVVEEAIATGADLLVTHHPLFLRGVHGVPATTAKGRLAHRLIAAGVALFVAHTNADVAAPGVSDALAGAVGVTDLEPLVPAMETLDKIVTFVPTPDAERVLNALAGAGAGQIGDYSRCAWTVPGTGTFLPGAAASPVIGRPDSIEVVAETRVELVLPRHRRAAVVAALRASHPYEEPAYDVVELAVPATGRGTGRIGRLATAAPLADFVAAAARALPATAGGLRATGDPAATVSRVAVCGGAGDGYLAAAQSAGVDAFLTADLRHHPASEFAEEAGPALIDAPHWATEWPWLPVAARRLRDDLAGSGTTVEVAVSERVTDPWTLRRGADPPPSTS